MVVTIPSNYGYVLAAAISTCTVSWYHSITTSKWRRLSGIKYPMTYATDETSAKAGNAFAFNCAQRAHANYTENHGPFVVLLMIAGIEFPLTAAYLGIGWTLARILYVYGYVNKGPPARHPWFTTGSIISTVTALIAGYTSYSIVTSESL